MHDDANARILGAQLVDLPDRKAGMYRTVPLPQDQPCFLYGFRIEAAPHLVRIPDDHIVERNAHLVGGVPPKMLIGEKENLVAALPRPLQCGRSVRRSAHDAAALSAKRFNRRRRVDVGDGNNGSCSAFARAVSLESFGATSP